MERKFIVDVSFERKICSFLLIFYLSLEPFPLSLPQGAESDIKPGKARSGEAQFFDTLSAPSWNK